MARTDDHHQYPLRIPAGLHLQLKLAARANGRTLNAEILHLIERGMAPVAEPIYTAAQVAALFLELRLPYRIDAPPPPPAWDNQKSADPEASP